VSSFRRDNDFDRRIEPPAAATVPSLCPACRSTAISTTGKSADANAYWRCDACGEVWNVGRRGASRSGANSWR
jgi:transposase-like protein